MEENARGLPGKLDAFIMDVTKDEHVKEAKEHVKQSTDCWNIIID